MSDYEGDYTSNKIEGSLSANQELGCIDLSQTEPSHTPPDLFAASKSCMDEGNYIYAVRLYVLAGIYGAFDSERLADESAHQAMTMLRIQYAEEFNAEDKARFRSGAAILAANKALCPLLKEELEARGHPTYYPDYMIRYGMGDFVGDPHNEPFVKGYSPEEIWAEVLASIKCPE